MSEVRDDWNKFSRQREGLGITVEKVRKSEEERGEWERRRKEKGKGKAGEGQEDAGDVKMDTEESGEKGNRETKDGEDDKMEMDEDGNEKPKEKVDEDKEPTLLELDDVDIERAKPLRKAVVMVDPGPDPVKGELLSFPFLRPSRTSS